MRLGKYLIGSVKTHYQNFISLLIASIFLVACAHTQLRTAEVDYYAGRLSITQSPDLQVADSQAQSWSAQFELAGNAHQGTLFLYTPVGTTIAKVSWRDGAATLESGGETQYYESLNELVRTHFDQNIPILALFDWLKGKEVPQSTAGWDVDFSRLERGIIKAERLNPSPRVSLKVIIDEQSHVIEGV